MKYTILLVLLTLLLSTDSVNGFTNAGVSAVGGGSNFVVSQRRSQNLATAPIRRNPRTGATSLSMGKKAKFGVFSPAVYATKTLLGEKKLNSIRGKGISLHSQAIGNFCGWVGATHLRVPLIQKAKKNGDTLGFLV